MERIAFVNFGNEDLTYFVKNNNNNKSWTWLGLIDALAFGWTPFVILLVVIEHIFCYTTHVKG